MMSCPDFETLELGENQKHLRSCDVCSALMQVRSLERPNPSECEEVEGLFAISEALSNEDRKSLSKHLAACPACAMAAYNTNDEDQEDTPLSPWKGPTMDTTPPQHSIPTTYAIAGGLAFATLAVIVALFVQSSHEDTVSSVSVPVTEGKTPFKATPNQTSRAGANRPSPEVAKNRMNPAPTLAWEKQGIAASLASDHEAQLKLCVTVLANEPGTNKSAYLCALAFGGNESVTGRFLSRIDDKAMQSRATQALAETPKPTCDEITCLVEPDAKCCARFRSNTNVLIADELTNQGQELVRDKKFGAALEASEVALLIDFHHSEARQLAAIAACNLKQFEKGYSHLAKIPSDPSTATITQICDRLGGTEAGENK